MKKFKGETRLKKQLLFFGYKGYVSVYSKSKPRIKVKAGGDYFKVGTWLGSKSMRSSAIGGFGPAGAPSSIRAKIGYAMCGIGGGNLTYM